MGGSLYQEEIRKILKSCEKFISTDSIKNFIETGTYKGVTTRVAASLFEKVYTIEIDHERFSESSESFKELKNIVALFGDSLEHLPNIMRDVDGENCLWFLDAHQSGSDTSNNGVECVPLMKELDVIFKDFKSGGILIVDDVRLFSKYWDWAGISLKTIDERLEQLNVKILKKLVASDRYILVVEPFP